MKNIDHTESIHKGLNYIVSRQTASGEFPSYISRDEDCVDLHLDGTIFPSIVTGITLKDIQRDFSVVDSTGLNQALNNLERFVLANQRYDSIWRFWPLFTEIYDRSGSLGCCPLSPFHTWITIQKIVTKPRLSAVSSDC